MKLKFVKFIKPINFNKAAVEYATSESSENKQSQARIPLCAIEFHENKLYVTLTSKDCVRIVPISNIAHMDPIVGPDGKFA